MLGKPTVRDIVVIAVVLFCAAGFATAVISGMFGAL